MKKWLALILILTLTSTLLAGCFSDERISNISSTQMKFGTVCSLKIYGYTDDSIFNEVWAMMDDMEKRYSTQLADSEVSKFNQSTSLEPFKVSKDIAEMAAKSLDYSQHTDGLFEITIYPLVKTWDIMAESPKVPTPEAIKEAQTHIDYHQLIVDTTNNTLQKKKPDTQIDLGAVAKGYAADQIKKLLASKGIERAIINLGGNIVVMGSKDSDHPWNVGIQDPFNATGESLGLISATNKSVVTSGTYERYFEVDGKRYHHIINPVTGYPEDNGLIAVSIISDSSAEGDCLSTSMFLLGLDKGMAYIKAHPEYSAIFITNDKKMYLVGKDTESFQLSNTAFTIANK